MARHRRLIPTAYDDGGFSGGTLERPALQRLLADIRERLVDVIVVLAITGGQCRSGNAPPFVIIFAHQARKSGQLEA